MCACACAELRYISPGLYKSALRHKNWAEGERGSKGEQVSASTRSPYFTFCIHHSHFFLPISHTSPPLFFVSPLRDLSVYLPLSCTPPPPFFNLFYISLRAVPLSKAKVRTDLISDWLIELLRLSSLTHTHTHTRKPHSGWRCRGLRQH